MANIKRAITYKNNSRLVGLILPLMLKSVDEHIKQSAELFGKILDSEITKRNRLIDAILTCGTDTHGKCIEYLLSLDHLIYSDRCSNRFCPRCNAIERTKLQSQWYKKLEGLVEYGFWDVKCTLPAEEEKRTDILSKYSKGIRELLIKFLGNGDRNLGILMALHPFGSSDKMRVRHHYHNIVMNLDSEGNQYRKRMKLTEEELEELRKEHTNLINEITGKDYKETVINIDFVIGKPEQLRHKLEYNLRSALNELCYGIEVNEQNQIKVVSESTEQICGKEEFQRHMEYCKNFNQIRTYGNLRGEKMKEIIKKRAKVTKKQEEKGKLIGEYPAVYKFMPDGSIQCTYTDKDGVTKTVPVDKSKVKFVYRKGCSKR